MRDGQNARPSLFFPDDAEVFFVGDEAATHGTEVGRFELTVDELASEGVEATGQVDEGELRGAGFEGEHALAEEGGSEVDAIESAHQTGSAISTGGIAFPHFDTGGEALPIEFGIGLDDVGAQPGAFFLVAVLGCGAASDDALEIAIDGDLVLVAIDKLAHGVADVDLLGEDDEALQGTEPQGLVLALEREPREIAIGVGEQQTIDTQVATHCYQSVGLAQMGVREPEVVVELKNHHSHLWSQR